MRTLRRVLGLGALTFGLGGLTLVLVACASNPLGEPEAPHVDILVLNALEPTTGLTVHALQDGDRDLLGTVVPSGRRTFRYHPSNMADTAFRLVAETGAGREITSPTFALRPDLTVVWDVEANTVEPG